MLLNKYTRIRKQKQKINEKITDFNSTCIAAVRFDSIRSRIVTTMTSSVIRTCYRNTHATQALFTRKELKDKEKAK